MAEDCRGEIIRPDGSQVPVERRSPDRLQPTYRRSAGQVEGAAPSDRRGRRRVRDEMLRGRLVDVRG
jgi:hypothetical protein